MRKLLFHSVPCYHCDFYLPEPLASCPDESSTHPSGLLPHTPACVIALLPHAPQGCRVGLDSCVPCVTAVLLVSLLIQLGVPGGAAPCLASLKPGRERCVGQPASSNGLCCSDCFSRSSPLSAHTVVPFLLKRSLMLMRSPHLYS